MDSSNNVWFIDEIGRHLGYYDPNSNRTQLYQVPKNDVPSGIAFDNQNNSIWITSTLSNDIFNFNTQTGSFSNPIKLPGSNAQPFSIAVDKNSGQIWVLDEAGKIANIDPTNHYNVTEYGPSGNTTLATPTALLIDPDTGDIYISEHEGRAISVFSPLLKTFREIPLDQDPQNLPFGLAMDKNHFLWVAQHTLNKIAVVDPRTGAFKEADIPLGATQTQWLTSDSQGDIWLAEQRGAALGLATTVVSPAPLAANNNGANQTANSGIFQLGVSFADIVGPSVAAGVIACAVLFSQSILNLNQSIRQVKRNGLGYSNDSDFQRRR
jgi:copper transport protein